MNSFTKKAILNILKNNRVERRSDNMCETYMVTDTRGHTMVVINNNWDVGEYTISIPGQQIISVKQENKKPYELQDVFDIIRATRQSCR